MIEREPKPPSRGENAQQPEERRNLNDTVLVKVLPEGERLWDASKADVVAAFPQHAAGYRLGRDKQGYTRLQLHDVMRIFGGQDMSLTGAPIETKFKFVADGEERSLNDPVEVKVLPEGEKLWEQSRAAVVATLPEHAAAYSLPKDEQGDTRLQLHEVMRVFGDEGMPLTSAPIATEFKFVQ